MSQFILKLTPIVPVRACGTSGSRRASKVGEEMQDVIRTCNLRVEVGLVAHRCRRVPQSPTHIRQDKASYAAATKDPTELSASLLMLSSQWCWQCVPAQPNHRLLPCHAAWDPGHTSSVLVSKESHATPADSPLDRAGHVPRRASPWAIRSRV